MSNEHRFYTRKCPVCGYKKRMVFDNRHLGLGGFSVVEIAPTDRQFWHRVRCRKCGSSWHEAENRKTGHIDIHMSVSQERLPGM